MFNGGLNMPAKNENENTQKESIFGVQPDSIQTYAFIHVSWELEKKLEQEIAAMGGDYLTLQDGEDGYTNGFIYNLSLEEIIRLAPKYELNEFIYGTDPAPSTPYFYQRNENEQYRIQPLEEISSYMDLAVIAPECSDIWKDLYFNDFFIESLDSWFGSFEENDDFDEEDEE